MSFNKLLQQSLIWRGFYLITALLLNVVLSRFLQAGGIGYIFYLANSFSLILLIASISMESAFTFYASAKIIDPNKLANFAVVWITLISIVLGFFFIYYFRYFEKGSPLTAHKYLQYALFFIAGTLLINFFTALFYAQRNFFLPNLLLGVTNIALILFLIIEKMAHASETLFADSFFYSTILQGIVLLFVFVIANKSFQNICFPDKKELSMLFRYSMVAVTANVIFFFVYRIDYWFVKYYCSPDDLGNYIQASKLGQMLLIVPQVISSAMFSQTASGKLHEDVSEAIVKLFRLLIQIYLFVTLIIALTGYWLFPFVFGESFTKIQIPLLLLLPGLLCLSALSLLSAYFGGMGKMQLNLKGSLYGLIAVIICSLLFAKYYSIYVAACISTLGYTVSFIYSLQQFRKTNPLPWKHLWQMERTDWVWGIKMITKKQL